MDDPLCRISIQNAVRPDVVDIALPRHAEVGLLLPDIVDLVIGDAPPEPVPRGWRLDRILGGSCDESMTLHESGITDGDVMVLCPVDAPAPGPLREDPFRTVRDAPVAPDASATNPACRDTSRWLWACAGMVAVATLCYSGACGGAPWAAAGIAALSAAVCVLVAWRRDTARTVLHAIAVGFVCVAGFLVTPGGAAPGVALGAAAGCAAAVWLLRSAGGDMWQLTAAATATALVTVATGVALALGAGLAPTGALLGVLALTVLGAAGRVAIALGGLRPPFPGDRPDHGVAPISEAAAIGGRTLMAGLVCGAATAVSLGVGAVVLAGGPDGPPWPPRLALAAVLAGLLLARIRSHADPRCRAALGWCGLTAATAAVALATVAAPRYAGPATVLLVASTAWAGTRRSPRAGATRGADIGEYVALAAVVPLAGWVGGLYELVRSSSLG